MQQIPELSILAEKRLYNFKNNITKNEKFHVAFAFNSKEKLKQCLQCGYWV